MSEMNVVFGVICFLLGASVGLWGYRYMLKRDPETLERWAQEAKALGKKYNP